LSCDNNIVHVPSVNIEYSVKHVLRDLTVMKYFLRKESDPFKILAFNNHDGFEIFKAVTMKNTVTCMSDYRRGLDW
jgi:hypothetical protein